MLEAIESGLRTVSSHSRTVVKRMLPVVVEVRKRAKQKRKKRSWREGSESDLESESAKWTVQEQSMIDWLLMLHCSPRDASHSQQFQQYGHDWHWHHDDVPLQTTLVPTHAFVLVSFVIVPSTSISIARTVQTTADDVGGTHGEGRRECLRSPP